MADWLSRSTSSVDHEEAPLMEEYVVNEVKKRLDGSPFEYDSEMKEVLRTIVGNDWNERTKAEYPEYFRAQNDITVKDGLLFKSGIRFIPAVRNRRRILDEGHGLHLGQTRMKARISEVFW